MFTSKYRYLIPNGITFLSLTCGVVSILASAGGNLVLGGALILTSYVLDLLDGALARKLNAGSAFGLQLDSLVDMVSLGVAPAVLIFMQLSASGVSPVLVWPTVVLLPLAGAFRLARFNLLPPKAGTIDSIGLTISTGGATIALAVLSDIAGSPEVMPDFLYLPLLVIISLLMVSHIRFPPFAWLFKRRLLALALLLSAGLSVVAIGFVNAWFLYTSGYLGLSLARAGYFRVSAG